MDTDKHNRKLEDPEATARRLDAEHEARMREITANLEENAMYLDNTDTDRLTLLDRLADRAPDLALDQHEVEWTRLPDGAEALVVAGGGFNGGTGYFIANAGDDLHVVGSLAPLMPAVGCIVIRPDGTRVLADVVPDPLAPPSD